MKRLFGFAMMLALLAAPVFAAKNSQTVNLPTAMKVGSADVTPGDYDVTWTGSGPEVQVTLTRNRKVVVTLPAKLVQQVNKNQGLDMDNQGGVQTLQAIRLRNMSLILEGTPSSGSK